MSPQLHVGAQIEAPAGLFARQIDVVIADIHPLYLPQDAGQLYVSPVSDVAVMGREIPL